MTSIEMETELDDNSPTSLSSMFAPIWNGFTSRTAGREPEIVVLSCL